MNDFPEKAQDNTNAFMVLVIGLATTAVLWASVMALQAYFENTEGEVATARASQGRSNEVRGLKAEHRADLGKTAFADASKGTLRRLDIEIAKRLVIRDAKAGGSLIPALGLLNVPTIPAVPGVPVPAAKSPTKAAPPSSAGAPTPAASATTPSTVTPGAPVPVVTPAPTSAPTSAPASAGQ